MALVLVLQEHARAFQTSLVRCATLASRHTKGRHARSLCAVLAVRLDLVLSLGRVIALKGSLASTAAYLCTAKMFFTEARLPSCAMLRLARHGLLQPTIFSDWMHMASTFRAQMLPHHFLCLLRSTMKLDSSLQLAMGLSTSTPRTDTSFRRQIYLKFSSSMDPRA